MCFAKVISINNQFAESVRSSGCIFMQPLDRTDSANDVFELIINTYNFSKAHTVAP